MSISILEFEKPIAEVTEKIEALQLEASDNPELLPQIDKLKLKETALTKKIYSRLTTWQKVQVARHPSRPHTLDFIERIFDGFEELHGDRQFADDASLVGGIAELEGMPVMIIGHEKGRDTDEKVKRNFGMPQPEGYRKAKRLMRLAERFNMPVITFIDTAGAYPGVEGEERGQSEAIARNLFEMFNLKTQVICIVIGEGASGGALGIGIGDKIMMLENTWYSVISPESCSSILWRSWDYKEKAAEVLKLTPHDMKKNKLIDKIIKEPLGGAHQNKDKVFNNVKKEIYNTFNDLKKLSIPKLLEMRSNRFTSIGVFNELN